jgi:hypothetical protein
MALLLKTRQTEVVDTRRSGREDGHTIGVSTNTVGHGIGRKVKNGSMKKTTMLAVGIIAVVVWLGASLLSTAQVKAPAMHREYAVIKWDGSDKVCVNLPGKSEIMHVYELSGSRTPKDMQEEEFCLAWMANKLAKERWEVVAFDSRRLVFSREALQ